MGLIIRMATAGLSVDRHPCIFFHPASPDATRLARMMVYEVAAKLEELSHEVGAGWTVGVSAADLQVWIAADEDGLWACRPGGEPVEAIQVLVEAAGMCGITVHFHGEDES